MSTWREQIEAQIADLRRYSYQGEGDEISELVQSMHNAAAQLEALKDVAVAAEDLLTRGGYMHGSDAHTNVADAIDKLREVSE